LFSTTVEELTEIVVWPLNIAEAATTPANPTQEIHVSDQHILNRRRAKAPTQN